MVTLKVSFSRLSKLKLTDNNKEMQINNWFCIIIHLNALPHSILKVYFQRRVNEQLLFYL